MRKVTFGGANSLDNFIAREDDSVDWLMWSDEVSEMIKEFWPKIDCVVMGRKTYDVAMQSAPKTRGKKAKNPYGDIATYVFSRNLKAGERDGVEIVNDDPGKFVRKLKKQKGKDICVMGGGELGQCLLEAGVIDEVGFNIHPVLLGSGIPLFHKMKKQINLELIECKVMKTGCVAVSYRLKKQ